MMKLLLAFVLGGLSLLCAAYSIIAYYRLVSIAKGSSHRLNSFAELAINYDDSTF